MTRAQRDLVNANRAYNAASDRARSASNEAARLRAQQYDIHAYDAQHAADMRRATRLGAQSHPDLVARLNEERSAYRASLTEGRRLMTQAGQLQRRLTRNPNDAEARTEMRRVQRALGRAQLATGYAVGRQGDAENALIRATLGQDDRQRLAAAEETARQAAAATRAAGARSQEARETFDQAMIALDLARGGTGVRGNADATALAMASGLFNRPMTTDDFARMVGARPGDQVHLSGDPHGTQVGLSFEGHGRQARMSFSRGSDGKLTAHVGWATTLHGANARRSVGAGRDLIRSMQAMHNLGVQRVRATAGGYGRGAGGHFGHEMNGYYTWAKMGFTGSLSPSTARAASTRFGTPLRTVQAVMQEPGGSAWWKANGHQFDATFNWSNSYSRAAFAHFAAAINRGA